MLSEKPVLQLADFSKHFFLFVDCSSNTDRTCLAQLDGKNHYRPVCFFSRKLSDSQKNYCVTDRKALFLILAEHSFHVIWVHKLWYFLTTNHLST